MLRRKLCMLDLRFTTSISSVKTLPILFLTVFLILFVPKIVDAQVVINEFDVFTSPQAIELINMSDQSIDISGWHVDDSGGATYVTIPIQTALPPNTCVVIRGSLNLNTSSPDTVRLFDNSAPPTSGTPHLVDSYAYTQITTAGNSYARNPDGSGIFVLLPTSLGLWNTTRNDCTQQTITLPPTPISTPSPTLSPTSTPANTLSPTITSPLPSDTPTFTPTPIFTSTPTPMPHIYISEVMVDPTSGNEWIELFNNSPYSYFVSDWSIDDMINGGSSPTQFDAIISPYGYSVVELHGSVFNNTGDSVRVIDDTSHEIEVFIYNSSQSDITWGRQNFDSNIFCLQAPSKGLSNNDCLTPTTNPTSGPTMTPTVTPVPSATPIPPDNIYLSELYVNTNADEHEWLELYNDNRYTVTLHNWKIKDASDQIIATIQTSIDAYRYVVVEFASDKMNNSDEQIILLNSSGDVADIFEYEHSTKGESWGRSPSSFSTWCLQNPSRNRYNFACIPQPTPTSVDDPTPTKTKSPTPTARLSIGNQKSSGTGENQTSNVLGTSATNDSSGTETLINFTPEHSVTKSDLIMAPENTLLEQSSPPYSTAVPYQFIIYLFLVSLCMIVGGYQIARIWILYKDFTPTYPDILG